MGVGDEIAREAVGVAAENLAETSHRLNDAFFLVLGESGQLLAELALGGLPRLDKCG